MDDKNREIILRVRLNQQEHATLVEMAATKGTSLAATLRQYIHQNNK
jgi:predicted HicB family RNase H-like nuclease